MFYAILIITSIASGGFASYVASKKGYDDIWFLWGLLFNFIALIAIAGLPPVLTFNEIRLKALEKKRKTLKNKYEDEKKDLKKYSKKYPERDFSEVNDELRESKQKLEKLENEIEELK